MIQEKFEQVLRKNKLVASGDRLLVAVSGGADSMALLHLLAHLSPTFSLSLVVAHLDHQLRPESADDAEFVSAACRQLNIPCIVGTVDVAAMAQTAGVGLEEAGRDARRSFLKQTAADNNCSAIFLAHHADDQAETLLFRFLRGSGLTGLAAMRPENRGIVRPLLGFRQVELTEYLQLHEITWREDASNTDTSHTRNRIRHQLLPQLMEYNPRIVDALNRLSQQAADEDAYWETVAASFLQCHGAASVDGFELDVEFLLEKTRAERRRILRTFLRQPKEDLRRIDSGHITQVEDLLLAARPQADLDLPGIWVARRYNRLICALAPPDIPEYEIRIDGPGTYQLPTGDQLIVSREDKVEREDKIERNDRTAFFAEDELSFPLIVRTPRPGDRFHPSGMAGTKLLKDLFIDEKIDRESRCRTPVICHGEEIIWLAGRRRCGGLTPVPGQPQLKIALFRQKQGVE